MLRQVKFDPLYSNGQLLLAQVDTRNRDAGESGQYALSRT
jgi:hypothetical protein